MPIFLSFPVKKEGKGEWENTPLFAARAKAMTWKTSVRGKGDRNRSNCS
jgi:hypothetical protein